jgi:hypothetical protein
VNNRKCFIHTVKLGEVERERERERVREREREKQFTKNEYTLHILVLKYTRNIAILKMICYFC